MDAVREGLRGVVIGIRVIPNSIEDSISVTEEYVKVNVRAPPEKGKANRAVISLFKELLGDCELLSGHKSRKKTVLIKNRDEEGVKEKLRKL